MTTAALRRLAALALAASLAAPPAGAWPERRRRARKARADSVTLSLSAALRDMGQGRRMSTSTYPVRMQTVGRAVQVQSDHSQMLPIYTRQGALYMAVRLAKGVNWVSGLPRGHYFINNRPLTID